MLATVRSDVRGALRLMRAQPGFTLVVVLTFAIGIGATTAMFGALDAVLVRALPYDAPDRLVMGRTTFSGRVNPLGSAYDYYDYRDQSDVFAGFGALNRPSTATVTGGQQPERVRAVLVSHDLFPTLGVRPVAGRDFLPAEAVLGGPDAVILSFRYATRLFGAAHAAVGRGLAVDGRSATIVGVMPPGFRFLYDVDVWMPMRKDGPGATARRFHNWLMVGRLAPGVTLARARSEIDVISKRLEAQYPDSNRNKALRLDPLQDAIVEAQRPRLWVMMGAVALLLLIACGNVAGLLLARGTGRRAELALRTALGASRARLAQQLLTEALLYALAGGALGIAFSFWMTRALPAALDLRRLGIESIALGWPITAFALGLSMLTGILAGVAPAFHGSSTEPVRDLTSARTTESVGHARIRGSVVGAQVAISTLLLVGAGLFIRTVTALLRTDPGFKVERLLTAEISLPPSQYRNPQSRIRFFDTLLERIRAIPGVSAAGMVTALPLRDPGNNVRTWPAGRQSADVASAQLAFTRTVLPGYFDAIGLPLVAGRPIERTDTDGNAPVLVINHIMAERLFPGENAVGRRVAVDLGADQPVVFDVIGIVADARIDWIGEPPSPTMYHSFYQFPRPTMRIAIRSQADPASVANSVRTLVWSQDSALPVEDLAGMDTIIRRSVEPFRTTAAIVTTFSAVALLLAAIGLYGALAYDVSRRRQEIGVRMALGARAMDVMSLVLRRGIVLITGGLAVGIGAALAGGRLVQGLLFGVEPSDPATYAFAAAVLGGVALAACALPAWRAVRVDPARVLRTE